MPRVVMTDLVSMKPGLIEFTRTRCAPSSHARLRVICSTALLEEWYATSGTKGYCIQVVESVVKRKRI